MPGKPTDVRPREVTLYFLPVETRLPLKFGHETLTHVTLARASMRVEDRKGRAAVGWGETPLSVQWVWPSTLSYEIRHQALKGFCQVTDSAEGGHAGKHCLRFQAGLRAWQGGWLFPAAAAKVGRKSRPDMMPF